MKKILNLWCWTWSNIPQIIKRWKIYNVDIDSKSIAIAKKRFPKCKYILSKAEDIKFNKKFFDEIYCFDVLEHVTDFKKTMKNIYDFLKDDGSLYVEIPYEKSEKILSNINKDYLKQIGHQRIFSYKDLRRTFSECNFNIIKMIKSRGICHIYLYLLFKLWIDISNQQWQIKWSKKLFERLLMALTIRFDKNILNTYLKYIPIRIITLPIGAIISEIFPKTIILKLKKCNYQSQFSTETE